MTRSLVRSSLAALATATVGGGAALVGSLPLLPQAVIKQIVALSPNHPLEVDCYDTLTGDPNGEFWTAHYVTFSWGGQDAVPAIAGMLIMRPDLTITALRSSGALPPA